MLSDVRNTDKIFYKTFNTSCSPRLKTLCDRLTLEVSDVLVVVVLEEEVPRLEGVENVLLIPESPERDVQLAQVLGQLDVGHEHLLHLAVQGKVALRERGYTG